jgi:SNF2 family DNA or RNA helicase
MTYQTREVPLTKQQEKYYLQMKRQAVMQADGELVSAVHAAVGLSKLLQISCGAVYSDTGGVLDFDAKNRLDEMIAAVMETAQKTIVFVPFRHAITRVKERLEQDSITAEVINGDVSVRARTGIIRRFQEDVDPRVLVIQPQSASHGITLTAADTIVWFGPIASVETWLQANERINRPSQKNKMTVIKLCGSPVERKVYRALEAKEAAQRNLTALYEAEIYEA